MPRTVRQATDVGPGACIRVVGDPATAPARFASIAMTVSAETALG